MFPTYVGMNRPNEVYDSLKVMFPTYVGMNRSSKTARSFLMNVPHVRGDEPVPELVFPVLS